MKTRIALIPAYEPDMGLVKLVQDLNKKGFEIVIVDDGSGLKYNKIFSEAGDYGHVLTQETNLGKGRALKTGLEYIKNKFDHEALIVTLDSDGQHSVEDASHVISFAQDGEALILGSRNFDQDVPLRSRFGNLVTRFIYSLFTRTHVRDTQTGLRAFKASMIPFMLEIEGDRYEYEMNVLLSCSKEKVPLKEVDIETIYIDNNSGSHFNTVKDSFRIYKEIIKFAASSFLGFLVDYSMYSALVMITAGLGGAISIPLSNVLARITSATVNYSVNRKFVFQNNEKIGKTMSQYFLLVALILGGNTVLLSFLVNGLNVDKYIAKLMTEITFFTLSWMTQKFIIFRKRSDRKEEFTCYGK